MRVNLKNRKLWAGALIILIAVAAGAYMVGKDNSQKASIGTAAASNSAAKTADNSGGGFSPISTSGESYSATVTTNATGHELSAELKSDGKGNTSYSYSSGGIQIQIIYTPDYYYFCSGASQCIKYPASQSASSGYDPATYQFSSERIQQLKSGAAYSGQQTCSTGTCDVWAVTQNNTQSKLYVDTKTKRIAEVHSSANGTTSKVVYKYENVTITPPANAISLPASSTPNKPY